MVMKKLFTVILPAAGNSTRFVLGDKLLTEINGRSILQRSVELFTTRDDVAAIILATAPERFAVYEDHLKKLLHGKSLHIVAGGGNAGKVSTRRCSVARQLPILSQFMMRRAP